MRKKVLVVDDEEDIISLLHATLGNDDRCQVLSASDGEEALNIIYQKKPDLIFLDILMPKMDGYEVCQKLKSDPATAHIKIIMLTALAQEFDRRKAVEVGADRYFTKPFSPTALLKTVEEVLGS